MKAKLNDIEISFYDWDDIKSDLRLYEQLSDDAIEHKLIDNWGKNYKNIKLIATRRIDYGPQACDFPFLSYCAMYITLSSGTESMDVYLKPKIYIPLEFKWDFYAREKDDDYELKIEKTKVKNYWGKVYPLKTVLKFYDYGDHESDLLLKPEVRTIIEEEMDMFFYRYLRDNNYEISDSNGNPIELFQDI